MAEKITKSVGRPTKYKPEYCQRIIEFFDIEPYREVETITTGKNDYEKIEIKLVPNKLPTFSKFARSLKDKESPNGLSQDAIQDWEKKYPDFNRAYNIAKGLQKDFLVDNGLAGLYPPASFIFTAKNITDMKDSQIIENPEQNKSIEKLANSIQQLSQK